MRPAEIKETQKALDQLFTLTKQYQSSAGASRSASVSETSKTNMTGPLGCKMNIGRAPVLICREYFVIHLLADATNVAPGIWT
jgi:hypothetical protein